MHNFSAEYKLVCIFGWIFHLRVGINLIRLEAESRQNHLHNNRNIIIMSMLLYPCLRIGYKTHQFQKDLLLILVIFAAYESFSFKPFQRHLDHVPANHDA